MANKPAPRTVWRRSNNPHHRGAFLKRGRTQLGRVLYSELTRDYSCFVGEPTTERWLGCAPDLTSAKQKVDDARAIESATEFLRAIKPGQRVSLLDPRAVNHPGKWCAEHVLQGEQPNLPYNPICNDPKHFRIYMRVWQHSGFVSNLCACELAKGSKQLAVWDMPADAKHSMSQTGFDNRGQGDELRTWQSTVCGVLLETTGGMRPYEQGHRSYISPATFHLINCPGCLMREGKAPQEIEGVTVFEVAA